jgi:hypothetical protein
VPAAPPHRTVVDQTSPWDGPAEEAKFDKKASDFNRFYAWVDKGEVDPDADGTDKEDGWGPHHEVNAQGVPGAANLKGVEAAVAALNGAHGGSSRVPQGDRAGVHGHLAVHYADAGLEAPELKADPDHGDEDLSRGKAIRADYRNIPEQRISTGPRFELREVPNGTGGTNLRFTGFASVTGDTAVYSMEDWLGEWDESISVSAFDKTLAEGADAVYLINHTGMSLARTKSGTLKLSAVKNGASSPIYGITGLYTEAMLDPGNHYVAAMRSAVDRGDLDEMSMAFRVTRQEWNAAWDRRWINELSLDKGDVSLVNYGANPHTGGTVSLRQRFAGRAPVGQLTPLGFMSDSGYEARKARARELSYRRWAEAQRDRVRLEALRYPAWDR